MGIPWPMGDFTGSVTVNENNEALFRYLSDVSNLPDYFSRMTSAEPGGGEEIKTTAKLPDGTAVSGDAWFRVNEDARRIDWGSEGPSNYSGYLKLVGSEDSSEVELHLHTTRVADGDAEIQSGIDETLGTIKRLVEQRGAAS